MAKTVNPAAGKVVEIQHGSFAWSIPRETLAGLMPVPAPGTGLPTASSSGMVLADVQQKCSIVHGDMPVNYTINVRIVREPIGNDEAALVTIAKDASKAKQTAKKLELQTEREKLVAATQQLTRDMMRDGVALGTAQITDAIKVVGQITPVLRNISDAVRAADGVTGGK